MAHRGAFSGAVEKSLRGAKFVALAAFACAMAMTIPSAARAQDISMTVQLTSALSSGSAHKGDAFSWANCEPCRISR